MPLVVQGKRLTPTDVNRLYLLLQGCGVSFLGAQQLLEGQFVTSPRDRRAIASMISHVSTEELERITFTYRKIAVSGDPGKMGLDDWSNPP